MFIYKRFFPLKNDRLDVFNTRWIFGKALDVFNRNGLTAVYPGWY